MIGSSAAQVRPNLPVEVLPLKDSWKPSIPTLRQRSLGSDYHLQRFVRIGDGLHSGCAAETEKRPHGTGQIDDPHKPLKMEVRSSDPAGECGEIYGFQLSLRGRTSTGRFGHEPALLKSQSHICSYFSSETAVAEQQVHGGAKGSLATLGLRLVPHYSAPGSGPRPEMRWTVDGSRPAHFRSGPSPREPNR